MHNDSSLYNRIIVHGHGNIGWELSLESKLRCELARNYAARKCVIVFSGGEFSPEQEGISISDAMRKHFQNLISNKKLDCLLLSETKSRTTIENVEEIGKEYLPEGCVPLVITSGFHKWRTWLIWRLVVGKKFTLQATKSDWRTITKNLLIESVGIAVVILYKLKFRWPEHIFRKLARSV